MRTRTKTSAVVALAVLLGACGSSAKQTETPSTTTATTEAPATTTTTTPVADHTTAVWPNDTTTVRYTDPVDAARGFATEYVGFTNPIVGTFQAGDARSGEVPVRNMARGPVTTVLVRQLGTDGTWWVLGSSTPNIVISKPSTLAAISSPVTISGTSTAFEAQVRVEVRSDDTTAPIAKGTTMGGSNGEKGPFSTTLSFAPPTSHNGAIVMDTISAADGHIAEASIIRIRFAA